MDPRAITEELLEIQADMQTSLGFLRLHQRYPHAGDFDLIEDRLARGLARAHRLLEALDRPMYSPAQHDDVKLPFDFMGETV
jgi:hypothetical protein